MWNKIEKILLIIDGNKRITLNLSNLIYYY